VQSVLGARDLRQGQLGTNFTAWLKILDVPLFILPGIICFLLFPGLEDENEAYMTMVTQLFPSGMVGLIVAVLIAGLVSTVDSALNSLSTVFTVDIYLKRFVPDASPARTKLIGRIVMAVGAVLAVLIALGFQAVEGLDLFGLFQAILGYLAPPMSAVFIVAVLWRRTTALAANTGLIAGSVLSLLVGYLQLTATPSAEFWPHFLLVSFYLFATICAIIVVVTLVKPEPVQTELTLTAAYEDLDYRLDKRTLIPWSILFGVMIVLYILFS
jgi:SSS family solute:Na+ symporter